MSLKLALWVSGILGAIALAMPALVELGLWLLIIPGLILMLAPTVFMYLATFAVLRVFLPLPPGLPLNAASAALTLLLGWAVVQPWQIKGRYDFAQAVLPDVMPSKPVILSGDIRIETDQYVDLNSTNSEGGWHCSALCTALLDSDGVSSVTIVSTDPSRKGKNVTYRIVPKSDAREAGVQPNRPGDIYSHMPQDAEQQRGKAAENSSDRAKALNAAWSLRLSTIDTLTASAPLERADQIIRFIASRNDRVTASRAKIDRLEVTDADGQPLVRKSIVDRAMLAAPLHFSGSGYVGNFKMGLARQTLHFGPRPDEFKPIQELFRHTSLARPQVADAAPAIMARLSAALDDVARPANDADFALATAWFASIDWSKPLSTDQAALLARAIADPRVPISKPLYDGYERQVDPTLRDALGARIAMDGTTELELRKLSRLLSAMPPGTFKTMTPTEQQILNKGNIRPRIWPFIVRLADQGAAGAPSLLKIMKADTSLSKKNERERVMRAVALGFARIGREAAAFLPEVDTLLKADRDRNEYRYGYSDTNLWHIALVRMGKPVDSIEWPKGISPQKEWLRKGVESYDPEDWSNISNL